MKISAILFGIMAFICIFSGLPVLWALLAGLVLFWLAGLKQGFSNKQMLAMAWAKAKPALIVVRIILLIGVITGLWRSSGTIAGCVMYGVSLMQPQLFLLIAFLICVVLSYILGTSYGVSSTAGVILMALARFGGVNPAVAAGVILSGVYFGDRCSPASSAASLVAAVTGTDLYRNVRQMMKTGLLPTMLTLGIYCLLSVNNPLHQMDQRVTDMVSAAFVTNWTVFVPAVTMLVLPLLRVNIRISLWVSIVISALVSLFVQKVELMQMLSIIFRGYHPEDPQLAAVLGGGGVMSMASSCCIVLVSAMISGVLEGTGSLTALDQKTELLASKIGRFPAMILVSFAVAAVLCNQAVTSVMDAQLMGRCYRDKEELAIDIENSGIMVAGLVPWSVACSVPLAMLGADLKALPFAVLLWITPVCYIFTKRWFYKSGL